MTQTDTPIFPPFVPPNAEQSAEPPKRQTRKKKISTPMGPQEVETVAPQKRQRRKTTAKAKRAPKFELRAILAATSGLKNDDMDAFDALLTQLQAMNKAQRTRLLEALGKVFT